MKDQEKEEVQKKSLGWKYSSFIIHNCGKYLVCLLTHRSQKCLRLGEMQLPDQKSTAMSETLQGVLYETQMVHKGCLTGSFAWRFNVITRSGAKIHQRCGWK